MNEQFKPAKIGEVSADGKFTPVSRDDLSALGNLRPEVREAWQRIIADEQRPEDFECVQAELLRLAAIEADALIALDCEHDWQVEHERAEKAEAELAEAQNTIAAQQGTMGALKRKLALAEGELAALKAMLTWRPVETAPVGEDVLTCAPTIYPWDIECKRADGEWERSDPAPTHWMPLPPPPKGED